MTRAQALAEAKARWGADAWVESYRPAVATWGYAPARMFKVYRRIAGEPPIGVGTSWQQAFERAMLALAKEAADASR